MKRDKSRGILKVLQEKYLSLVLTVISVMILSLCFQDTINYDEYFSVQWCRLSWGGQRHIAAAAY